MVKTRSPCYSRCSQSRSRG